MGASWHILFFDMAFAARDEFLAMVQDRESFIRCMLGLFPELLDNWEKKQIERIDELAKSVAEGDEEIEVSIRQSESRKLDVKYEMENLFYQASFLVAYSALESSILALSKELSVPFLVDAICKSKNHELSPEAKEANEFVFNEGRILRNNLCHNNSGTLNGRGLMEKLCREESAGICYDGQQISFVNSNYIDRFLNQAHVLLAELCGITGHKVKYCGK